MATRATYSASASVDIAISSVALAQHGVVTRAQLRALGLSDGAITARARRGVLHRLHHSVYAVGHAVLGARGRCIAATLACGPAAALSHASAAALWELRPTAARIVDVTVPGVGSRRRAGLRIHRARVLEVTTHDGIPVTTPARTILDLAATLQRRRLERLLDQAENTRLTDVAALEALAGAHPGHRGAGRLHAALATHTPGTTITRSELEERFLALCDRADIPRPLVNHHVAGLEVDFVWPARRLIVETDGWAHHRTRHAFERDRARDAALAGAGYRTLRFTYRQVTEDPAAVASAMGAATAP